MSGPLTYEQFKRRGTLFVGGWGRASAPVSLSFDINLSAGEITYADSENYVRQSIGRMLRTTGREPDFGSPNLY